MAQTKKPGYDKLLKTWTFVTFRYYGKVITQDWSTVFTKVEILEFKMYRHTTCLYTGYNIEFTAKKKPQFFHTEFNLPTTYKIN